MCKECLKSIGISGEGRGIFNFLQEGRGQLHAYSRAYILCRYK